MSSGLRTASHSQTYSLLLSGPIECLEALWQLCTSPQLQRQVQPALGPNLKAQLIQLEVTQHRDSSHVDTVERNCSAPDALGPQPFLSSARL